MRDEYELLPGDIPCLRVGASASPLVVLNGGQAFMRRSSAERFRRDAERVKRIVPEGCAFVLLGYGPAHQAEAGLDGLADTFAGVLRSWRTSVRLVAISYGGLVASRLAARHPGLVSDLILISSADAFSAEGLLRVRRQIDLASQERHAELLAEFGGVFRRPWYNWLLKLRLTMRRTGLAAEMNTADHIAAYLRAGLAADGSEGTAWLRQVAARTLVISGARDQFFGERTRETAAAIDGARLCLLPEETHMAPVERARVFRREITAFLSSRVHPEKPPSGTRSDGAEALSGATPRQKESLADA